MMTYDCGHKGKRIPDEVLSSEIYHNWLNQKPTVCFECHLNQLADESISKADSEHCQKIFAYGHEIEVSKRNGELIVVSKEQNSTSQKGNVVESEVSNV